MTEGDALVLHTIYRSPADYPGLFVGRTFRVAPCGVEAEPRPFAIARTLDEVRAAVPPGSRWNLGRSLEDEPQIVETWV